MGEKPIFSTDIHARLGALGLNPNAFLSEDAAASERAATREVARATANDKEIQVWQDAVASVQADTATLQERLETCFKKDVETGHVLSDAEAIASLADIDRTVARGPQRSWTYNHSGDPKYKKTQPYFVTVDDKGNIMGEFPHHNKHDSVSQYPVKAGKHVIRKNPTL